MIQNQRATVLFYGDSRAADWPFPAMAGVSFINRGMPGEETAGALRRFRQIGPALTPEVMVLQLGINDLVALTYAPERRAAMVDRCQANLRRLVSQAVAFGTTVILSTIFPPAPARFDFWGNDLARLVLEVIGMNEYLTGLAGEQVVIFDAYHLLAEGNYLKPAYALDLLHLNRAGYTVLNQVLIPCLKEVMADEAR
jgi:lysophospholipase L1-like esterase